MSPGAAEAHQHHGGGRDLAAVVPHARAGDREGGDGEQGAAAAARSQAEGPAAAKVRPAEELDERDHQEAEGPHRRYPVHSPYLGSI